MNDSVWGLSSSSDSDSDDDRPITKLKTNTEFYRQFQNGYFGPNWTNETNEIHTNHVHTNHSYPLSPNVMQNESIPANTSCPSFNGNESRILSPSLILNTTPENIVLIQEGDKFRPVRVITTTQLLSSKTSPEPKVKVNGICMHSFYILVDNCFFSN